MDNINFTPDSSFGAFSGSTMDLDFMDELLYGGCWLETADKLNLSQPGPSTSSDLNDPSKYLSFFEPNSSHLSANRNHETFQEVTRKSTPENTPFVNLKLEELVGTSQNWNALERAIPLVQSESFSVEGAGSGRRWWIGPSANSAPSSSVKDRLLLAITQLKESTKDRDVLMQIWVPVEKGGKHVLTTIDQPFFLNPNYKSLASYRSISESYYFQAEADSKEWIGLPGRVYLSKLPEWTPDVRSFRSDQYPRKIYAKQYNISGSLAVPVFERGSGTCLGVVEVVTTTQNVDCHPDLENICKALEAVELTSSKAINPPSVKACKEFFQAAVPEISEILGSVCTKHGLPLALTWAPCFRQGKGGCQHFDENYVNCFSTVDSACFVASKDLLHFHTEYSKQHLFLDQGIVGRAFATNTQCFASNITSFSQTHYPFSHHAKMFGLRAAVAIPLRSVHAGPAEFVLELFLPKDCQDIAEQKRVWGSLSVAIQQACRSLQVILEKENSEDFDSQMMGAWEENQKSISSLSKEPSSKESSLIVNMMAAQQKGKGVRVSWDCPKEEPKEEFKVTTHWDNMQEELYNKEAFAEFGKLLQNSGRKCSFDSSNKDSSSSGYQSLGSRKAGEKKRTKTEKTISLEVLRRYFAGSLKDAAKSIGVCPTTLKRICRQHGINRWPSRKLKKVGHSLKKLQLVIDSVQGAEGAIQIGSFYTAFPELSSPNLSGNPPLLSFARNDASKQQIPQPESAIFSAEAAASKSLSSSSQSSGSSISCSTGVKPHNDSNTDLLGGGASIFEVPSGILKRTLSNAELHVLNPEEPKLLVRSQSHKTFDDLPSLETLLPFPRIPGQKLQDQGTYRVKATFGEDKIRFCLQPSWNYNDLQKEIARRFNIGDACKIDLKYLDDDHEWVLLTCDADLEECKDIYRSSRGHTIRISLHQGSQPQLGSSCGSGRQL